MNSPICYRVYLCNEGCDIEFIAETKTEKAALNVAARAEKRSTRGTPRSLWETARAAGGAGVPGCNAPSLDGVELDGGDGVIEWFGNYVVVGVYSNY